MSPIIDNGTPIGIKGDTAAVKKTVLFIFAYLKAISIGWPSNNLLACC